MPLHLPPNFQSGPPQLVDLLSYLPPLQRIWKLFFTLFAKTAISFLFLQINKPNKPQSTQSTDIKLSKRCNSLCAKLLLAKHRHLTWFVPDPIPELVVLQHLVHLYIPLKLNTSPQERKKNPKTGVTVSEKVD